MSACREVLRSSATRQAGFHLEELPPSALTRRPILFLDGEEHRAQRARVARLFAPRTVDARYRGLMEARAEALVAEMAASGTVRLEEFSLRYAVDVAAQVIGLTASRRAGMTRRLDRFFAPRPAVDQRTRLGRLRASVAASLPPLHFYLRDVRPAIRAHRRTPQEDVISHLLAQGRDDRAILMECITFGAAGMVTTREFISMAVWHLLDDEQLRDRYLAAAEPERHAILREVLRLEPIVGHLYRRAVEDLTVGDGERTHTIRAGELVDLHIRQANADPSVVGDDPESVCPGRRLPRGIGAEVESFGDGPHTCPGNALAIQETDILLRRLLAHRVEVLQQPTVGWDDMIAGYSLRGMVLRVGPVATTE